MGEPDETLFALRDKLQIEGAFAVAWNFRIARIVLVRLSPQPATEFPTP
ncbi:hypothetical protein [Burkholderia sp. Bp8963]|nr:hypothetical protein [Burkholderia sp. Bp8963]